MLAPTRRAAPVTSAVWPVRRRRSLLRGGCGGFVRHGCAIMSGIGRALNAARRCPREEQRTARRSQASSAGQLVASGGWLSFERFMQLALYAPGLGYYSAGSIKIGPGAISSPPRRCRTSSAAAWRANAPQVLRATGGGEILELGAGTGRMAAAAAR